MEQPQNPSSALSDADWETLSAVVASLEDRWFRGDSVDLALLLPAGPSVLRRRVLIEWLKVEQELRHGRGELRGVEAYLTDWPELARDDDTILELIQAECMTRAAAGDLPTAEELARRFPELADRIDADRLVGLIKHDQATDKQQQALLRFAPPERPDEIGRVGPYRVLNVIGRGGMGIVFRAEDVRLQRPVALKVMPAALATDQAARQRFLREARAMAAIEHDNLVAILHVGEENELPFLAMPLLRGESLRARLERERRLPMTELLNIGTQICAGLSAAHRRGLVHRDIKPSNIWIEAGTGRVKILDFGLARTVDELLAQSRVATDRPQLDDLPFIERETNLTVSGSVLGTPAYMAPEQSNLAVADHRADLYSLGCVLHEMATGELPTGRAEHASGAVKLPNRLAALVDDLLRPRPEDRPTDARAVGENLQAIRVSLGRTKSFRRHWLLGTAAPIAAAMIWFAFSGTLVRDTDTASNLSSDRDSSGVDPAHLRLAVSYPIGLQPFDVVTGDFNGDGTADLIASNMKGHSVSLLLGNGDGTFRARTDFPTGKDPMGVCVADFNQDRHTDIAVANSADASVEVLLGDGRGRLKVHGRFAAGLWPRGVIAADFNQDGKVDLAVANNAGDSATVLLGDGAGSFPSRSDLPVGKGPAGIAVGDLNSDGRLDLAVGNGSADTVSVLLGEKDKGFLPAVHYAAGSGPGMLVVADFNSDKILDVATENFGSDNVCVLMGRGDGSLLFPQYYTVGSGPGGLLAADVNNDGTLDLLCANHNNKTVSLLGGLPNGTFQPLAHSLVGDTPVGIAAGDFNRDGQTDFAVANHRSDDLSVVLSKPAGPTFHLIGKTMTYADGDVQIVVGARNAADQPELDYQGTVRLSTDDPKAQFVSKYTFTANDRGLWTLPVKFRTAGAQGIRLEDVDDPERNGTHVVLVQPLSAVRFELAGPASATVAEPCRFFLQAADRLGNQVNSYSGGVQITCSDSKATITPASVSLLDGNANFEVRFRSAGVHSVRCVDPDAPHMVGSHSVRVL